MRTLLQTLNAFRVNLQYFVDYKLAGNATDVVKYRNYFLSFLGFAAQIPNLILNGLNVFLHCKGSVILSLPVSRVDYPFFLPLLPVYPFLNTSTHFRDSDFQTNFRAFSPVSTGEIRDCGKFWRGVSKKSRLYDTLIQAPSLFLPTNTIAITRPCCF